MKPLPAPRCLGRRDAKVPLAQWLTDKKLASAARMAAANAMELGMPLLDFSVFDASHNAMKLVSGELLRKHHVLPLFKRGANCS